MSIDLTTARLLASMLCPDRAVDGAAELEPASYPALVKALIQNKVPLLALRRDVPRFAAFYASETFCAAYEEEDARWSGWRAEYLLVREAFERAGIRDVFIKSTGIAPSLSYASDNLDILVAQEQGNRARMCLLDLGYVELKNVEEPCKFLFRKFHLGQSVSAIHLHEMVGWGTGFMDDAGVLAHARPSPDDPAVWIPAPEDGALIIMAHAFYEDKAIKLGDLWKVMHVLQHEQLDWAAMYGQVARRGWREGLDTCIWLWAALERALYGSSSFPREIAERARQQAPAYSREYLAPRLEGEPRFPFTVSFRFSKRHYYGKVSRDTALAGGQKFVDALRHSLAGIRRRLPPSQPAMLVTLSGIDGSGKTVHAEYLRAAMKTCDIASVTAWSRGGSSRLTDLIIGLVKPLLKRPQGVDVVSDTREAKVARKGIWLTHPVLRVGWTYLVVLDMVLRYGRLVAWPLLRGRVVVSDRYTYDALVELAVLAQRAELAGSFPARLLRALCPRPALAYFLDVSPAEALRRKPDEVAEFLAQQAAIYHQMAEPWGLRVVDVDGDLAAANDELVRQVLRTYYRDWRTPINSLFLANPLRRP